MIVFFSRKITRMRIIIIFSYFQMFFTLNFKIIFFYALKSSHAKSVLIIYESAQQTLPNTFCPSHQTTLFPVHPHPKSQ